MENLHNESTQDRVNLICNQLYGQGIKPSVRIVLAELPDIKSTSTVHKYFANWRKEIDANQKSLYEKLGFSPEFTQSFMKEITRFSVEAEQRYKNQASDAIESNEHAIADLKKVEDKLHKQNAVVDQQEKEINELQSELLLSGNKYKSEIEKGRETNEATVAELRKQLIQVKSENTQLSKQNESLHTEVAKAELKIEGNQSYVDEIKHQNQELVKENKELNLGKFELSKTVARLESTISGNEKLIASLQSQQNNLTQQNKSYEDANNKLEKSITEMSHQLSVLNGAKAKFDDKIRSYEKALQSHEATISSNEKLITRLESQIKT